MTAEVAKIADLKTLFSNPTVGDTVLVKGHTAAGDGGGGVFCWRTESQFKTGGIFNIDNNGTVISITGNNNGEMG